MSEPIFPEGLRVYSPHEKAPDFVKGAIVIERDKFLAWIATQDGDVIRLDIKESKGGKLYAAVNTYKRGEQKEEKPPKGRSTEGDEFVDDGESPF